MTTTTKEESFYFLRDFVEVPDRLDSNYSHPRYDIINPMITSAKYAAIKLGESQEKLDPRYLVSVRSGKTPKGIKYVEVEGVPFVGATCVYDDEVHLDEAPKISTNDHNGSLLNSQIKTNDVLVTMAGSIGRCAVYESSEECNCNQAIAILTVTPENLGAKFLSYYLNSTLGQLFFGKLQHVASQPNINLDETVQIQVVMPPELIQRGIVAMMDDFRRQLASIDGTIQNIKERASLTLISELGFNPDAFDRNQNYYFKTGTENRSPFFVVEFDREPTSRLSFCFNLPNNLAVLSGLREKFSTTTLENICTVRRGEQPEYLKENHEEEGILAIKTVDLRNERLAYESCLKVSKSFFDNHPNSHVKKNDVLVASTGYVSMGKVDIFDREEEALADGHVSILTLREAVQYNPYFLMHFLRSSFGKVQFERLWTGSSGQIEITDDDLKSFIVPDSSESGVPIGRQSAIVENISAQLSKIGDLQKQKDEIRRTAASKFDESMGIHSPITDS